MLYLFEIDSDYGCSNFVEEFANDEQAIEHAEIELENLGEGICDIFKFDEEGEEILVMCVQK